MRRPEICHRYKPDPRAHLSGAFLAQIINHLIESIGNSIHCIYRRQNSGIYLKACSLIDCIPRPVIATIYNTLRSPPTNISVHIRVYLNFIWLCVFRFRTWRYVNKSVSSRPRYKQQTNRYILFSPSTLSVREKFLPYRRTQYFFCRMLNEFSPLIRPHCVSGQNNQVKALKLYCGAPSA